MKIPSAKYLCWLVHEESCRLTTTVTRAVAVIGLSALFTQLSVRFYWSEKEQIFKLKGLFFLNEQRQKRIPFVNTSNNLNTEEWP
jgi:hypothetical protein